MSEPDAPALTVWGRRTSSNVQAVLWCLAELGLDCTQHDVGFNFGGTDTDEFGQMNPNRLVPVLQDGDDPHIWESAAILRYIASRYGSGPFWPEEHSARAQVDKWAEWAKLNVTHGFTVPIFWRVVRTAPSQQDPDAIAAAIAALTKTLRIAEQQLSQNKWLAGDAFTLADIQLGHILFRYFDTDIDRADLPALRAYYDRLVERPAYRQHVMVSYEILRVT